MPIGLAAKRSPASPPSLFSLRTGSLVWSRSIRAIRCRPTFWTAWARWRTRSPRESSESRLSKKSLNKPPCLIKPRTRLSSPTFPIGLCIGTKAPNGSTAGPPRTRTENLRMNSSIGTTATFNAPRKRFSKKANGKASPARSPRETNP